MRGSNGGEVCVVFKTAADVIGDVLGLVREVLRSRVGMILFLLNLALVSCAYAANGYSIMALFDPGNDSLTSLAAFMLNFPMILATALVTSPVLYERRVEEFGVLQWAAVTFIFFCVLFQWWVYGYLVERRMGGGKQPSALPSP